VVVVVVVVKFVVPELALFLPDILQSSGSNEKKDTCNLKNGS